MGMTADENLKTMREDYEQLFDDEVDVGTLQNIVRRMLGRQIQHEEAMRDMLRTPNP